MILYHFGRIILLKEMQRKLIIYLRYMLIQVRGLGMLVLLLIKQLLSQRNANQISFSYWRQNITKEEQNHLQIRTNIKKVNLENKEIILEKKEIREEIRIQTNDTQNTVLVKKL